MALFSALGSFFVRIFLAGAIFTFWPVIQAWRDLRSEGSQSGHRFRTRPPHAYSHRHDSSATGAWWWKRFSAWPVHKKIVAGIWSFMIFIFLLIFGAIIFSPDDSMADYYYEAGNQFYNGQSYDSACINYRKALKIRPAFPGALFGYGNTMYTRNYPDSSIYYYDKAIETDPGFDDARYNKAWVYFEQKKYDMAIEALQVLLEGNPSYYVGMQLMGDSYYAKNEYSEALNWYEQAYNGGIRGGLLCERMAYIYDTKNERDRAVELYKEAVSYDNTLSHSFRRLGELVPGEEGSTYRQRASELQ